MRRRIARKPKILKVKEELFHLLLSHKTLFSVTILHRSPRGHNTKISFVLDTVEYWGIRQLYVRSYPQVDSISLYPVGVWKQLSPKKVKDSLERIREELHDNVSSHKS